MSQPPEVDLFGVPVDPFKTALDRYGVWPTTVWEVDYQDAATRELKALIGDVGVARPVDPASAPVMRGGLSPYASERNHGAIPQWGHQTREGSFTKPSDDLSVYRGKITASIFNPAVAAWLLNCFAPTTGHVFDPFAGGGTRAILSAKRGLTYYGTEVREAEVLAVRARVAACGIPDGVVTIAHGDARECDAVPLASADFCLTCPPYWNLEQYQGGPSDLSMQGTYTGFLRELGVVIRQTYRILKPGAHSCWVVGLLRAADGELLALHHDVTRLHREAGFTFEEEIILNQQKNGAIQRVGNFERGDRRLVRTHEYALVFTA